jgi:hypothetical protein
MSQPSGNNSSSLRLSRGRFSGFWSKFRLIIPGFLAALGSAVSGIAGAWIGKPAEKDLWWLTRETPGILLLVSALVGFLGAISVIFQVIRLEKFDSTVKNMQNLQDSIEKMLSGYDKLMEKQLSMLVGSISNFGTGERISVYRYNEDQGVEKFTLLGRHSKSPLHKKKVRLDYPRNMGILGTAWEKGECFEEFPDPNTEWSNFVRKHQGFGYDEPSIRKLRMKTRTYAAIRLQDSNSNAVGVVLFESEKAGLIQTGGIFEQRTISDLIFNSNEGKQIIEFMENGKYFEPNVSRAVI